MMWKLASKNSGLHQNKSKLQGQLKQKEEAGEVRQEVDFEQLKIENKQYNEKFEEKNDELLKLKCSAISTSQVLNSHKVYIANVFVYDRSEKKHWVCKINLKNGGTLLLVLMMYRVVPTRMIIFNMNIMCFKFSSFLVHLVLVSSVIHNNSNHVL